MELPARFVRDHIDAARACDVDVGDLLVGLSITPALLDDPKGRVPWSDFAELTDRIGAKLGSNERIEEFGSYSVKLSAPWALYHLVPHVVGPGLLLRVGVQFTGPAIFPHIRHVLEKRSGGAFRLRLSLPAPYRECETFFRACVGGIGVIPTLFNYAPARVVPASVGPRGGVYDVTPPPSRTLLHRLRSALRALGGESALFDEIARQHESTQGVFGMLLRTQTELRQLMERIPEPLLVHRDGVVLWMNRAFLHALKRTGIDEVRGEPILAMLHPGDKGGAARLEEESNAARSETLRFRASDGSYRSFEVSEPQSVIFEEAPARMTLARDVTERDALREQLVLADRMSQLGFVAAGVAHEINNPLAYALAALERAKRDMGLGRFESAAEALSIARNGAERVRGITNDLRIFARGGEQRPEVADVAEVLRATADLAASRVRAIGHLALDLRPTPHVFADVGRLGQVFMNLLANAIDAVAARDPKTNRISVRSFADAEGRAIVEIEDNGCGISEEIRARIFEPFFTTKGPRAGSGLGLAICHRIVTDLGGRIEVEPAPGGGAIFRVLLVPDATLAASRPSPLPHPRSIPRLRILVIDDEPPLASALGRMLEDEHDVEVVTSAEDALARLEVDGAYDAILCDLMMAGMGGMEVHAKLLAGRPALARRLVFMTGGAFNASAQRFLGEVKNPCLDKPFTKDEVLGAMNQVCRLG